ncbi:MAG: hypothetical protein ACI4AB_13760 [Acetatifactor sp.]
MKFKSSYHNHTTPKSHSVISDLFQIYLMDIFTAKGYYNLENAVAAAERITSINAVYAAEGAEA